MKIGPYQLENQLVLAPMAGVTDRPFRQLCKELGAGTAVSEDEASAIAERIGFPVLVRPSFVLGGRGMMIVYNDEELRKYIREAADVYRDTGLLKMDD